jgi:trehalose 6-phosphate synthase/phosphatase
MLGADVVGFQTANYSRHWRQTVSRILSFEALPRGIQVPEGEGLTLPEMRDLKEGGNLEENVKDVRVRDGAVEKGRFVDVGVFPMGIDVKQLHIRKWVFFLLSCFNSVRD